MRKFIIASMLAMATAIAHAQQPITMYVGEIKLLRLAPIERVAVGLSGVLSTSLLKNGQLLLLAEGEGESTVHVWFEDGKQAQYAVKIIAENMGASIRTMNGLLENIPGVTASMVGDKMVIRGDVPPEYGELLKVIVAKFPDAMNMTQPTENIVRELLYGIEGVEVSTVGEHVVLRGDIHPHAQPIIETIMSKYPAVMNLTTSGSIADDKMVFMNVKITEFNKNKLQNLGIQWDNPIAGPAAGVAADVVVNDTFRITPATPAFSDGLPLQSLTSAAGYFGIAMEISSRINFLVNSGDAVILSEPRLSTRSGGEATFLAGGEIPLPTTGSLGQSNVEFKEFGVSMTIRPIVDQNDRIMANVATEISQIDNSIAVEGIPGFLTRKTETDITINSGETLVISGLLDQSASKDIEKLKYFGDLPVFGRFFRNSNYRNTTRELVIFVTPTVYDASSQLNQDLLRRRAEGVQQAIEAIDEKDLHIID